MSFVLQGFSSDVLHFTEVAVALTIITENHNFNKSKKEMCRINVKPFSERRN